MGSSVSPENKHVAFCLKDIYFASIVLRAGLGRGVREVPLCSVLSESSLTGTPVLKVVSTDADSKDNKMVHYQIVQDA